MTVAEFIEELQEDYDPDVQIESIRMKTTSSAPGSRRSASIFEV